MPWRSKVIFNQLNYYVKLKMTQIISKITGTRERRSLLRQSKLFECDCSRCSDPTECSTYLSALRCQKCPTGFVLPIRPLDEKETEWKCNLCSYKLTAVVVNRVVDKLKEEFETIGPNEVEKYLEIFKKSD
jgi:PHP family Zn ribbon phosphoesterase